MYYFKCGGSILDETTVLTAAHCFINESNINSIPNSHVVIAGSDDLLSILGGHTIVNIKSIYVPIDYDSKTLNADIAVVKVINKFKR